MPGIKPTIRESMRLLRARKQGNVRSQKKENFKVSMNRQRTETWTLISEQVRKLDQGRKCRRPLNRARFGPQGSCLSDSGLVLSKLSVFCFLVPACVCVCMCVRAHACTRMHVCALQGCWSTLLDSCGLEQSTFALGKFEPPKLLTKVGT